MSLTSDQINEAVIKGSQITQGRCVDIRGGDLLGGVSLWGHSGLFGIDAHTDLSDNEVEYMGYLMLAYAKRRSCPNQPA